MTVKELREALAHLPDDMPVVYVWTWLSPKDVCIGKRRGNGPTECLLLDGNLSEGARRFGNIVLWQEADKQNEV
jgi:hypothetical protein